MEDGPAALELVWLLPQPSISLVATLLISFRLSVTDHVKLGNGVQAYISYRVITKAMTQDPPQVCSISPPENELHSSGCLKPARSSPEMDPTIWNMLPEELLDHILSFISLETLLNLRSTCKRFDTLFLSPSFISN
ncbi:unnamed protein product [Linum tenue]|uniref:F-box domain-containing protein n=1 Tax=Linum tenue TaxID=586396 RepID=A0AAV0I8N6_9ROSI|nr:unnamed protein product [Linum tenue]